MTIVSLSDLQLGLRAAVLASPRLAALPGHLMNQPYTVTDGPYWQENLEILSEDVVGMGGYGYHTVETTVEYLVTVWVPIDGGTGAMFQTSSELLALCPPGQSIILPTGQATVMRAERIGPKLEDGMFYLHVRLDVLAYSTT